MGALRLVLFIVIAIPVLIGVGAIVWVADKGLFGLLSLVMPPALDWFAMVAINFAFVGAFVGGLLEWRRRA